MKNNTIDTITLGIVWDNLISIADEILLTLVRTSFSITVREAWDAGVVIFDASGRPIAQGSMSTPAFTGTAFYTMEKLLKKFPVEELEDGDVIITNDPWIGTGHLPDVNILRPVFRNDRVIGFVLTISHLVDVGGRGASTLSREVFEEGLLIPPVKIYSAGKINELLIEIIKSNVRVPDQVLGDIMGNISGSYVGGQKLLALLDQYELDDLQDIADGIISKSAFAIREKIQAMPDGSYTNQLNVETDDEKPITLACTLKIENDSIKIDFAGTSPCVAYAINVPLCYTRSWCAYTLKCLTTPSIPNNLSNVLPLQVSAPNECILNAHYPAATYGRNTVGWYVVPLLMGAFAKAIPEAVQAETGMAMTVVFNGQRQNGRKLLDQFFATGGLGGMAGLDGQQTTPAPTNCALVSSEIWEDETDVAVLSRRILPDSGGAGEFRGGAGQEIIMKNNTGNPITLALFGSRTTFPAKGYDGGKTGGLRAFKINNETVSAKGVHTLEAGEEFIVQEAGGGGFGDPKKRCEEKVIEDYRNGFITVDGAKKDYGVEIKVAK
ncbi:MAG: N-methylhydantoinase B [Gammaproteobacteria bacterium]|jgi:N-methylhydantoinase B